MVLVRSTTVTSSLLGLALGAATGCTNAAGPPTPEPPLGVSAQSPEGFRPALLLADSEEALRAGATTTHFNFAYVRDLWFRAKVPSLQHVAMLNVKFVSPQQTVFYEDNFPFSPDERMTEMSMPQASHPLTVLHAHPVSGGLALDHMVPIAGSVFQRYPMPGTWLVQVRVDGYPNLLTSEMNVEMTR